MNNSAHWCSNFGNKEGNIKIALWDVDGVTFGKLNSNAHAQKTEHQRTLICTDSGNELKDGFF